eukprot:3575817-Pyramimonas_sp.AAC.1
MLQMFGLGWYSKSECRDCSIIHAIPLACSRRSRGAMFDATKFPSRALGSDPSPSGWIFRRVTPRRQDVREPPSLEEEHE